MIQRSFSDHDTNPAPDHDHDHEVRQQDADSSGNLRSDSGQELQQRIPDQPDLLPVRMLNEFTYCPRLGYLEFVHGEWADNLETRQGSFGHRRVDRADRRNLPAPDSARTDQTDRKSDDDSPEPIHARSLTLSSEKLGLIAKLDLVELEGNSVTPVDYKRGKVPDIPAGAYDPERVQVCAQALILRENGYQCDEAVLYYIGSRRRVRIPIDDPLIALTLDQLHAFRETAARSQMPPPLVDSPKCPRCSLVGICLPDEVTLLRGEDWSATPDSSTDPKPSSAAVARSDRPDADTNTATDRPDRVRMLFPARPDAVPLYVQEQGAMLAKSGDRLVVKKRGEVIAERRLMDVSQVSVFGAVMLTAAAVAELSSRNIPVCHFSYGGWFHSVTCGLMHRNVELRIRQFEAASDPEAAVLIARQFISGKIRNGRTLLRRHLGSEFRPLLKELDRWRLRVESVSSPDSLFGLEGMAARVYFRGLFELIGRKAGFRPEDRNRRPPRDPVNAVLSFAYAMLTRELTVTLQAVGFDPMLGLFHRPRYGRPSLALDLAEEYRPLIADSVMLTAFNNGELSADRFIERAGAVTLTQAGRSALIGCFERRMETEVTHPLFGYRISYRRLLEVQARLLSRTLLGELDEYPAFCTR